MRHPDKIDIHGVTLHRTACHDDVTLGWSQQLVIRSSQEPLVSASLLLLPAPPVIFFMVLLQAFFFLALNDVLLYFAWS